MNVWCGYTKYIKNFGGKHCSKAVTWKWARCMYGGGRNKKIKTELEWRILMKSGHTEVHKVEGECNEMNLSYTGSKHARKTDLYRIV